jgi:hypothetical protein
VKNPLSIRPTATARQHGPWRGRAVRRIRTSVGLRPPSVAHPATLILIDAPSSPFSLVLYDVSSSWLEGRCCELGRFGYSRDQLARGTGPKGQDKIARAVGRIGYMRERKRCGPRRNLGFYALRSKNFGLAC